MYMPRTPETKDPKPLTSKRSRPDNWNCACLGEKENDGCNRGNGNDPWISVKKASSGIAARMISEEHIGCKHKRTQGFQKLNIDANVRIYLHSES